ncbi:MAG TPA: hypothetical protein VGG90_10340 [Candidatus Dormibacteraeota bacterium]
MSTMIKPSLLVLAAVFGALALVGCDSTVSSGPPATSPPQSPAPVTNHPAQEAVHPDPNFDWGYTVQITDVGFHPKQLLAPCCQTVTWKNMTHEAVVVVFDHLHFQTDPIPAGGSFSYLPKGPQAISYYLNGTSATAPVAGSVIVQQTIQE